MNKLVYIFMLGSFFLMVNCNIQSKKITKNELEIMKYESFVKDIIYGLETFNINCPSVSKHIDSIILKQDYINEYSMSYSNKKDCTINKKSKGFKHNLTTLVSNPIIDYSLGFFYKIDPYHNKVDINDKWCNINIVSLEGNVVCKIIIHKKNE